MSATAKTSCGALCATTRHRASPFPSTWYSGSPSIPVPTREGIQILVVSPPLPLERTADYDINSFARAVLKHKGAFSGGIRRATVIIPRLLPPAVPTNRATDSSDINNFNSRLRAKECDRRHTLIPDRPGLLPHVGRARFVSRGENCSLLRSDCGPLMFLSSLIA